MKRLIASLAAASALLTSAPAFAATAGELDAKTPVARQFLAGALDVVIVRNYTPFGKFDKTGYDANRRELTKYATCVLKPKLCKIGFVIR